MLKSNLTQFQLLKVIAFSNIIHKNTEFEINCLESISIKKNAAGNLKTNAATNKQQNKKYVEGGAVQMIWEN